MGRMGAEAMAEQVREGALHLQAALRWHLQSNHYPPLPEVLIPAAMRAIERGNKEQWHRRVRMPKNLLFRGKTLAPVGDLIEALHLESFLNQEVQ